MQRVDVAQAAAALERGEALFDTRSPAQYARDAIPGSRNLTLEQVQAGELPELDREAPLYLVCSWGTVSELVGMYLEAAGFRRVYTVVGGLTAWNHAITDATRDTDRR